MQRKYRLMDNAMMRAVYIKELDMLVVNTDPESSGGVIVYVPPKRSAREYV